jgi:hypothetical protein
MKAKDKARDLCGDFYAIKSNEPDYGIEWEMAKQCALIAVDEIIKSINPFGMLLGKDYWEEVRNEIEKL